MNSGRFDIYKQNFLFSLIISCVQLMTRGHSVASTNYRLSCVRHFWLSNHIFLVEQHPLFSISLNDESYPYVTYKKKKHKQTYTIVQGSFRPLTIWSGCHFSFFIDGKCVITSLAEAWVGLISHHGLSVSIISLSDGIVVTANKFSSVFNELQNNKK